MMEEEKFALIRSQLTVVLSILGFCFLCNGLFQLHSSGGLVFFRYRRLARAWVHYAHLGARSYGC